MDITIKNRTISRQELQLIAVLTMLTDHIACALIREAEYPVLYMMLRLVGRLAFPLYCYMIVQGLFFTQNVIRYLERLFFFAVLSEIPYDLAIMHRLVSFQSQNVLFTLGIGLAVIAFWEESKKHPLVNSLTGQTLLGLGVLAACCLAAWALRADYGGWGVLLIFLLYMPVEYPVQRYCWMALWGIGCGGKEVLAVLAVPLMERYDPDRPQHLPGWFMYLFYPAHLAILGILRYLQLKP